MKTNKFYKYEDIILINYSRVFPKNEIDILKSEAFTTILNDYYSYLKKYKPVLFNYLVQNKKLSKKTVIKNYSSFLLSCLINDFKQVNSCYTKNESLCLELFENLYNFYREKLRIGFIYQPSYSVNGGMNFIDVDNNFNKLMLSFYRNIEEKIQGKSNVIYRQLNAGTNGCAIISFVKWDNSEFEFLQKINFITSLMLRTPLFLKTNSNKRIGSFKETQVNIYQSFKTNENIDDWLCYPIKINSNLGFIYFHRDFVFNAIGLSNLFEIAKVEEYENKKPDLILFFGMNDTSLNNSYYYDEDSQIYFGCIAHQKHNDYFGYMKKMVLTLHNLSNIQKNVLPVHGSMITIKLKNKKPKNIVFMGDSGTGKSETIEMLNIIGKNKIEKMDVIFDDMGSFEESKNTILASGTETGAFLRLDDLEKETQFKNIDRSIFYNADKNLNARVIIPVNTFENISKKYEVDMFLYANNYDDKTGIEKFNSIQAAKQVFCEGKRFAIGTTNEIGITKSFFANPFGCVQKQSETETIIDNVFEKLFDNNVYVGQIFTKLGIKNDNNKGLKESAKLLLKLIEKL